MRIRLPTGFHTLNLLSPSPSLCFVFFCSNSSIAITFHWILSSYQTQTLSAQRSREKQTTTTTGTPSFSSVFGFCLAFRLILSLHGSRVFSFLIRARPGTSGREFEFLKWATHTGPTYVCLFNYISGPPFTQLFIAAPSFSPLSERSITKPPKRIKQSSSASNRERKFIREKMIKSKRTRRAITTIRLISEENKKKEKPKAKEKKTNVSRISNFNIQTTDTIRTESSIHTDFRSVSEDETVECKLVLLSFYSFTPFAAAAFRSFADPLSLEANSNSFAAARETDNATTMLFLGALRYFTVRYIALFRC